MAARSSVGCGCSNSMKPVPWSLSRSLRAFRSVSRPYLVPCDATVAVAVEAQDEGARLVDELLARDFAVLVLVKISEIRVCQGGVGLLNGREFGSVELAVVVAIC